MSDVAGVRITDDVAGPFMASSVGVTSADVFRLQGFELLEGTKLVCHGVGRLVVEEDRVEGLDAVGGE